jgi:hypothetical protein
MNEAREVAIMSAEEEGGGGASPTKVKQVWSSFTILYSMLYSYKVKKYKKENSQIIHKTDIYNQNHPCD